MKDRVFLGALGAIVLGWALLYWFLVHDKRSAAIEKEEELNSKVAQMQQIAKTPPESFPSDALSAAVSQEAAAWEHDLEDSKGFYRERDRKWEGEPEDVGTWKSRYLDRHNQLEEAYRKHAGIPEGKIGFQPLPSDIKDAKQVPGYELRAKVQETLVNAVMKHGGTVEDLSGLKPAAAPAATAPGSRPAAGGGGAAAAPAVKPFFQPIQTNLTTLIAPRLVNDFLADVLNNDVIHFQLVSCDVTKVANTLVTDVVVVLPEDQTPGSSPTPASAPEKEPPVKVVLALEALDWIGEPKP